MTQTEYLDRLWDIAEEKYPHRTEGITKADLHREIMNDTDLLEFVDIQIELTNNFVAEAIEAENVRFAANACDVTDGE